MPGSFACDLSANSTMTPAARKPRRLMYHDPVKLALVFCLFSIAAFGTDFDVKTYGAKADGKTPDRDSINKAIEAASAAGGGTVNFPAGTYLTGSIRCAATSLSGSNQAPA